MLCVLVRCDCAGIRLMGGINRCALYIPHSPKKNYRIQTNAHRNSTHIFTRTQPPPEITAMHQRVLCRHAHPSLCVCGSESRSLYIRLCRLWCVTSGHVEWPQGRHAAHTHINTHQTHPHHLSARHGGQSHHFCVSITAIRMRQS